jgi:Flp pilus assembly pilin Flp
MKKFVLRLIHEDDGQDLIEYVLIAAAVSVFLIPIVPNLGNALSTLYGNVTGAVNGLGGGGGGGGTP